MDTLSSLEREKWLEENADRLSRMDRLSTSSQNQLAGAGQIPPLPMSAPPAPDMRTTAEMERTLKSLNGYHEGLLEALRNAASAANNSSHRGSQSSSGPTFGAHRSSAASLTEELRKNMAESYLEFAGKSSSREKLDGSGVQVQSSGQVPPSQNPNQQSQQQSSVAQQSGDLGRDTGPIRIRNLEDLIRQLEHSSRHISSPGSDEMRDGDQDRHFR